MAKKEEKSTETLTPKEHLEAVIDALEVIGEYSDGAAKLNREELTEYLEPVVDLLSIIEKIVSDKNFMACRDALKDFSQYAAEHKEDFATLEKVTDDIKALAPFLQDELERDPAFNGVTLAEILINGFDTDGQPIEGEYLPLIERAQGELNKFAKKVDELLGTNQDELPRVKYKKTADLKTLTDRLVNEFYSFAAPQPLGVDANGQRQFIPVPYEGKNSNIEITLFYDYIWNEEIIKKYNLDKYFTDFDFFVMSTLDNLFSAGNTVVSFTKIFYEMGGEGSPTTSQLEAIYRSILKGMSVLMTIEDYEVLAAWNKSPDGKYHQIVSPVIPATVGNERFIANGKISNGYVKITDHSPFWKVAEPIGHITAWEKGVLKGYTGRKTARYYSVLRFLMQEIGWMRNGKRNPKITYSRLYTHTGDKTSRDKQLTRDMMYRLLDEVFKPLEYISAYKEEATPTPGVNLTLCKKRLETKKKK